MASSSSAVSLTVYEQERQKNIEKNKAVLAELGLGDARRQLLETHKKDVVEKIKRRYNKKSFAIDTPRRSARIQGKPVRYLGDSFGSEEGEEDRKIIVGGNPGTISNSGGGKRKYSFYDIEDEGARPKYKNELTTCHFCRKRDRKPKTRCGTCGVKYWVGDCCRGCFEQHFEDEDFDEVMMNKDWVCYCCRKKCPCLECIAGITKGRRYGPRKFKETPKEDYSSSISFPVGVVPDQFSLFSPLPLPSFFSYPPSSNGIPQFNFPMLPQPHFPPPSSMSSPPHPSAPPPYSHHSNFSTYPSPSLFSSHHAGCSNYTGGFPALQSAFGGGCVSPQNIFGMSPLPPPNPHPHHYMGSPYLNQRDSESLGNGAVCGFKMAQVIAQITNAPASLYGNSYNLPQPNIPIGSNNNDLAVPHRKRGRKPKGFNFSIHGESVSSDPMNSNDMYEQPLDILPPIKIPKKRGRPKREPLPALSLEEEALSGLGISTVDDNIDGPYDESPETPLLTPPQPEKKKRGRPKNSKNIKKSLTGRKQISMFNGGSILAKKRGRPKSAPMMMPPSPPGLSASTEMMNAHSPSDETHLMPFDMHEMVHEDEFFAHESANGMLNNIDDEIFNDLDNVTSSFDARQHDGMNYGNYGDVLKLRLKLPGGLSMLPKKRGRKPKKGGAKKKEVKLGVEKRKYTKRVKVPRDMEDTSNLRRSARPPQASRAFDDHYLL